MCIPETYSKECAKMMEDSAGKGFPIACISGRDRYECIERVGRKEADIVAVDPEDMYLAAKNKLAEKAGYNVVEQVTLGSDRIRSVRENFSGFFKFPIFRQKKTRV